MVEVQLSHLHNVTVLNLSGGIAASHCRPTTTSLHESSVLDLLGRLAELVGQWKGVSSIIKFFFFFSPHESLDFRCHAGGLAPEDVMVDVHQTTHGLTTHP